MSYTDVVLTLLLIVELFNSTILFTRKQRCQDVTAYIGFFRYRFYYRMDGRVNRSGASFSYWSSHSVIILPFYVLYAVSKGYHPA